MSDSSFGGTGSTYIKEKKNPLLLRHPPRENDWLVASEWWMGSGTLIRHCPYSLFGVHNNYISFRFDSVVFLLDL